MSRHVTPKWACPRTLRWVADVLAADADGRQRVADTTIADSARFANEGKEQLAQRYDVYAAQTRVVANTLRSTVRVLRNRATRAERGRR